MPSLSSVKGPPQQGLVTVNPEGSWTCLSHQAPAGSTDRLLDQPTETGPQAPVVLNTNPQPVGAHGAGPPQTSQLTVRHLLCARLSPL